MHMYSSVVRQMTVVWICGERARRMTWRMLLRRDTTTLGEICTVRFKKRTFDRHARSHGVAFTVQRRGESVRDHYWNCHEHIFPFDKHCWANTRTLLRCCDNIGRNFCMLRRCARSDRSRDRYVHVPRTIINSPLDSSVFIQHDDL